ncbi:MAG: DUF1918 domain-containing protein [Halodesulfurarchaeum sp.]
MAFEEGDTVVLSDRHSEFDGQVGEVTRVVETMFGDANYTVSFDEGEEAGVPEDALEPAEETDVEDAESDDDAEGDSEEETES